MNSIKAHEGLIPLSLTLSLLMSGCPGDDGSPMDTDTNATTGGTAGTTNTTSTTNSTNPTDSTETSADSNSTTVSADSTAGPDEESSGGPPPEGTCVGFDQVGNIATVLVRGDAPMDTTCDPMPTPCGGDVVGTWAVQTSCGYDAVPNLLADMCRGSTSMYTVVDQTGSTTFDRDGTFTRDVNVALEATLTLDTVACFGVSCEIFSGALQRDDPDASCVDDMGTCTCTIPPDPASPPVMGTYEVMDNTLILTVDGVVEQRDYCVNGDRLDVWDVVFDVTEAPALCDDDQDCIDALGDRHEYYVCALPE